jgi:hypothetical protein
MGWMKHKTCSCPLVRYFWTLFWDDITKFRDQNLLWILTEKEFVYLIFIGQKTSYFRCYVHVRKSPDDMNKSLNHPKVSVLFIY